MAQTIDFQNGVMVGLTMKGILTAGGVYAPVITNDTGVYTYFYIDFKAPLNPFTLGMLKDSIKVSAIDGTPITITAYEKVSSRQYKIYANIAAQSKGVTVTNGTNTLLSYSTGVNVPVFSTTFYVKGLVSTFRLGYFYDTFNLNAIQHLNGVDTPQVTLIPNLAPGDIESYAVQAITPITGTETFNIHI